MTLSTKEQKAIITGASSGIGQATALAFAKAGIEVALVSRTLEKLEKLALKITAAGGKAKVYSLDLSKIEDVSQKISLIIEDLGGINILINNAGMGYTQTLAETSWQNWQKVLDLNLTSALVTVQGVLPKMREQKQGTIINVTSIAATQAFANWGAYSVSKAGLVSLSKVLAVEERANGIRVMMISPGAVNTSIWDSETVEADFDRTLMLSPETVAQAILYASGLPTEAVIPEMTILPNVGTF